MDTKREAPAVVVLDTRAAADFLGLSPRTLEGLRVKGGGIPFVKIGGAVRYRLATLEAYLQQQERASTSDPGPQVPVSAGAQASSPPASRSRPSCRSRPLPKGRAE
jgi:hypothetical protein